MSNVIDLDAYRPGWLVGLARCPCGYKCVSVVHVDTDASALECPRCGAMTLAVYEWVPSGEGGAA